MEKSGEGNNMGKVPYNKFKDIVIKRAREEGYVSWEDFSDEASVDLLRDLGLSSLDVMEIIIGIEKRFGVRVEDDKIHDIHTVSDLWALFS